MSYIKKLIGRADAMPELINAVDEAISIQPEPTDVLDRMAEKVSRTIDSMESRAFVLRQEIQDREHELARTEIAIRAMRASMDVISDAGK